MFGRAASSWVYPSMWVSAGANFALGCKILVGMVVPPGASYAQGNKLWVFLDFMVGGIT